MIKILIELLEFLRTCTPLLFSLGFFTLFFVLLAKSIRKHAAIYYTVFAIPFFLYLITYFDRMIGFGAPNFVAVPVLGEIIRDYIHVGSLSHPILIIIMYVGALDVKIPFVKKLMSIRKEISIISGFPILTHSLVRVTGNFPNSLKYFTNNTEYMETARFTNELGLGISNFSYVLGILLVVLFIPLWVTSFDSVHKRMGGVAWKKLQKWSYGLYALLFIHAMGLQIGGMLNPRAAAPPRPPVEASAPVATTQGSETATERHERAERPTDGERTERPAGQQSSAERQGVQPQGQQVAQQAAGAQTPVMQRRAPSKGIPDIQVSREVRQYIHIVSLVLIYGSYLFLRVRKAKRKIKA